VGKKQKRKAERKRSAHAEQVAAKAVKQSGVRVARRPALDYELDPTRERVAWRFLQSGMPGLEVLRQYDRGWLRADVFAGVAVAAYLVPQVMAYTAIMNTPPVTGLWTALAALLVYAVLGSSRVLSPGPESTVALMAATAIAPLVAGDPGRAMALTAALSLVVAGWLLVARVFRLGVISDLLSQPLLVGYLAGGAVLMIVGQLGKMTGTSIDGESIVDQLRSFLAVIGATHLPTLIVGVSTLALLLAIRVVRPSWPAPLIAVVTATAVSAFMGLEAQGVAVVGEVPTGLPMPHLPAVTWAEVQSLLIAGLGVAIVAYGDITLIARGFPSPPDDKGRIPEVDPNRELIALAGVHAASGLGQRLPGVSLRVSHGAGHRRWRQVAAVLVGLGRMHRRRPVRRRSHSSPTYPRPRWPRLSSTRRESWSVGRTSSGSSGSANASCSSRSSRWSPPACWASSSGSASRWP
jgi:SulP family sulfate permease